MTIVRDPEHSDGAPTVEGTGICVKDVAVAYEHSGYDPDEITQLYPDLSLSDVHTALAYYYDHIDELRASCNRPHPTSLGLMTSLVEGEALM